MPEQRRGEESADTVRGKLRAFALGLPEATEEFPWGESVAKVCGKGFVFLGSDTDGRPPSVTLKLPGPDAHAHALSHPGTQPAGYGLGRSGWLRLSLDVSGRPDLDLLRDGVEESYRAIAPERLVARLDRR